MTSLSGESSRSITKLRPKRTITTESAIRMRRVVVSVYADKQSLEAIYKERSRREKSEPLHYRSQLGVSNFNTHPLCDQNCSSISVGSLATCDTCCSLLPSEIDSRISRICEPVLPLRSREIITDLVMIKSVS